MGRAKLKLELIESERSRRTTYQNRLKGLKKKISELSILSDVKTCAIIFGPGGGKTERSVVLDIWPENQNHVCDILNQFLKYDVKERGKREVGIEDLFKNQTKKLQEELNRLRRENDQTKYPIWDNQLDHYSLQQLGTLSNQLDLKLELMKQKLLNRTDQQSSLSCVKPFNQCLPIETLSNQHQPGTVSNQLDSKLELVNQILFDQTEGEFDFLEEAIGHFSAPPNDVHQQPPLSYGKSLNQCFPIETLSKNQLGTLSKNQLDSKIELIKQILFDETEGELDFLEEAIGYFSTPPHDVHQQPLSYGKPLNQCFPIDCTSDLNGIDCANSCIGPISTDLPYTYAPSVDKFHQNSFMLPTMDHEFGLNNSSQASPGYFIPTNNQQMPWFFQNPPQFYDSMDFITAAADSSHDSSSRISSWDHENLFNNGSQGGGSFFSGSFSVL
ncbi:hypothetical protein NE237_032873 [Protea cynaroides]|uniref:MADS-box domain-containing protein n=1 Tax=Protea cynaroides TaxID=273540 RepID=A0A9Q0L4T9_9MAGN|nr:hypothetical protein NE237_032873 [Protea cynaroides]